jgi:glycosyltransferase involved in cell wall biosynthesis
MPMKILFLSNFYPPHHIGGYGMLCLEVAESLGRRGHTFNVLTSTHGVDRPVTEGHIFRLLSLESDLHFYQARHAWLYPNVRNRNLRHLRQLVETARPDVVFVWGMWCLSKHLAAEAETLLDSRVVYYLANPWPIEPNMHQAYWDMPAQRPGRHLAKQILRLPARLVLRAEWEPVQLRFQHAPCCSQALREQLLATDVPLQDAPVIYEGIDLVPYLVQADRRDSSPDVSVLSLLYVGILAPHKGVHTTIEALALLPPAKRARTRLTILGSGHPEYEARLRGLVEDHDLSQYVVFHSPIPRSELPEFLGRFDVLLLPSTWEEPLARIMQEGLASGMVVVGSATGGTAEIIVDGDNGLLFRAEDAYGLAAHIERLTADPPLRRRLAKSGRRTAAEKFDMSRMVDEIEAYLEQVHATAPLITK